MILVSKNLTFNQSFDDIPPLKKTDNDNDGKKSLKNIDNIVTKQKKRDC